MYLVTCVKLMWGYLLSQMSVNGVFRKAHGAHREWWETVYPGVLDIWEEVEVDIELNLLERDE